MLHCFDEPLLSRPQRLIKTRHIHSQQRSRLYSTCAAVSSSSNSTLSSLSTTTDLHDKPNKTRSFDIPPPARLYGALAIFNRTDHVVLSHLEEALRLQQAEKAWQLFYLMTVPYHHCTDLYALLLFAQELTTHPDVIAMRQQQLDKVATYVEEQLGQPKHLFIESISRRPIPTYKKFQQALRRKHRILAWRYYLQLLEEDKLAAPMMITRNRYLKLLSLLMGTSRYYLKEYRRQAMVHKVTTQHEGIPCEYGRTLTAEAIEWIAKIYCQYDHERPKLGRKLVKEFLRQHPEPAPDTIDELIWRVIPYDLRTAQMILDTMHTRDLIQNETTYCNLIKAYSSQRKYSNALSVFEQMLSIGVTPSIVSFNAVLHTFAKQGLTEQAVYIWDTIHSRQLIPDAATFSEMILCFGHSGHLKMCLHYYHLMVQQQMQQQQQLLLMKKDTTTTTTTTTNSVVTPNLYTFSILIEAYGKRNDLRGVLKWFHTLLRQGLTPNEVIVSNVLKALGKHHHQHNMMEAVQRIAKQCMMAGIKSDTVLYTLLLTLQATSISSTISRSSSSSSSSSSSTIDDSELNFVLQSHREMLAKCVEPNAYTYTALIGLCGQHGYMDTAQQIFDLMQQSEQHQPTTATYCAMLELCRVMNQKEQVDLLLYDFLVQSKSNGTHGNRLWVDTRLRNQFRCYHGC
ncbi:uncharacterized protein BX664DRAFT_297188 [Halteromyces radiatus]|uniref:uncharacterized protein n=1 Tax=Halteromyces radiatus TaxID=101107 RepID=UPI0022203038|nr:uncharacterized protein BX664DRAFT_297188 [Halteromyces radiatus]KAI8089456.1 hypothetical protein BX664DRAFT_297188 [Halteromyces radiatus]